MPVHGAQPTLRILERRCESVPNESCLVKEACLFPLALGAELGSELKESLAAETNA